MSRIEQACLFDDAPEYDAFVDKFKPKKTTDDCYTPLLVFQAIQDWVCAKYDVAPESIVRPFYPGGDYESFEYPERCVVLDNPPFSILSEICRFYLDREIQFFLFAPSLTALSGKTVAMRMNHIICDADIVYENGAVVRTAFVTNFGGDIVLQTAPDLGQIIRATVEKIQKEGKKTLPKYTYPMHVVTAAIAQRYAHYGVDYVVRRSDCVLISKLDAQKEMGKAVFGGGLLLSERAAAERAAAERAAAERAAAHIWALSSREMEIVKSLASEE